MIEKVFRDMRRIIKTGTKEYFEKKISEEKKEIKERFNE